MKIYIYALIHPLTKEIRYIGKTINPKERLSAHRRLTNKEDSHKNRWIKKLKKENLLPDMIILEKLSAKKNWQNREKYWIKYFKKKGISLTNETEGGEGWVADKNMLIKMSKAQKLAWSKRSKEDRKFSIEHKNNLRKSQPHVKPILQLTLSGCLIKGWDTISLAAEKLNIDRTNLKKCLHGKRPSAGGFKWSFKN